MKKLLALAMALVLAMSVVTVGASAQTVVKFWTHQNTAWNESYEGLIAEFEAANPDIKIEYSYFPWDDFESKIQTSLLAGDAGADVYEAWGGWMMDFSTTGSLAEVPAELMNDLLEDSYEPVLGTLTHDGKYYGVPVEFNSGYGGIVVNKKLFEEAGIEYPTTWAEVIDIATKVAVTEGELMPMRGLEYISWDTLVFNWLSMILQNGGDFRTADGKLDFNTPVAADTMRTMMSYITENHVTNLDTAIGAEAIREHGFVAIDECFMATNGPWVVADCVSTYGRVYGEDVEYIAQPAFVEGAEQKWVAETGWSMCVAQKSTVQEAAWKFVEFLQQPENMLRHNIACDQIPARASVAQNPEYLEARPYMKPIVDILDKAVYMGSFNSNILKGFVQQMFISLVSNDGTYATVEDAMVKLNSDLEANLVYYN